MSDSAEIVQALTRMSRTEIEEIQNLLSIAALQAPDQTPAGLQGSSKDSAVQSLAAWALRFMREEGFRRRWQTVFTERKPRLTYAEIGEQIAGVTRERVRQLHLKLNQTGGGD